MTKFFIKNNINNKKGLTLFEVLLAIAIVTILALVVLPGFAKIKRIQVLKSATEDVVSVIGKARSQTLASIDSSEYGVYFETDQVVLFKGTSYLESNPDNQNIEIIFPATVSAVTLTGGATSLYFNRLSGLPSASGNISISVPGLPAKNIAISAVGVASVN